MAHVVKWKYGPYDCRVCLATKLPSFELPKGGRIENGDMACDTLSGVAHAECCSCPCICYPAPNAHVQCPVHG